jgi:hypothetical protein
MSEIALLGDVEVNMKNREALERWLSVGGGIGCGWKGWRGWKGV